MASRSALGSEALIDAGAVRDFLGFRAAVERGVVYPHTDDDPELDAFAVCDLAVPPSALARLHVPSTSTAPTPARCTRVRIAPAALAEREAERFAALRRPFDAARHRRALRRRTLGRSPARNLRLAASALRGAADRATCTSSASAVASLPAHTHGVVPRRRAATSCSGRSKVAVFPGLADAAPGGMFEASAMGCNVVASPDCGFWELCHDDLRVPTPSAAAFLDRIELARARPFADQRERFRGDSAELVETLAVF